MTPRRRGRWIVHLNKKVSVCMDIENLGKLPSQLFAFRCMIVVLVKPERQLRSGSPVTTVPVKRPDAMNRSPMLDSWGQQLTRMGIAPRYYLE
jgi:hypothetical protein